MTAYVAGWRADRRHAVVCDFATPGRDVPTPGAPPMANPAHAAIVDIVQREIIPRLYQAHCDQQIQVVTAGSDADCDRQEAVARLFISATSDFIAGQLRQLLAGGISRAKVHIGFLGPVPGTLSRLWSEGRCSFDEIACGLCCMEDVLQRLHDAE